MLSKNKKIILHHYTFPTKQVDLIELQKISESWKIPFFTFQSLEQGCGDVLHLLIKKKENRLEEC